MSAKKEIKPLGDYRDQLAKQVSADVLARFDHYCQAGQKIAAIRLLRQYNIIE